MYDIRTAGKQKKKLKILLAKLSLNLQSRIKNILQNYPYPQPTHGDTLCKVEKKGPVYCIEVTGGDRILYSIIEIPGYKAIKIEYAGNEDGEIKFLRKAKR